MVKSFKEYIEESTDPHAKVVAKLEDLHRKIGKYSHRWNENPSPRMTGWVRDYDDLRERHRHGAWKTFCDKNKLSHSHNAMDCLA